MYDNNEEEKKYTIIDHFKDIRKGKYKWQELSEYQQSTFSPYLCNLFLAQNTDTIELLNLVQPYVESTETPLHSIYNLYSKIIPMIDDNRFYKFIKKEKEIEAIQPLVEDLSKFLGCSRKESYSYITEKLQVNKNKSKYNVIDILCLELMKLFGHSDEEIKKVHTALCTMLMTDVEKKSQIKQMVKKRKK